MRSSLLAPSLFVLASFLVACGDDTGSGGAGGGASGGGGTGEGAGTAGGPVTGGGGEGPEGGAGGIGEGGAGGNPMACAGLIPGPIEPILVTSLFNGAEDLTFDGNGGIVAKDGGSIIRVDANDMVTDVATLAQQAYGLRYGSAGDLFVARPGQGTVVKITGGTVTDFLTDLDGPNGVYPDLDGNVWVTEFGGNQVIKADAQGQVTVIASGNMVSSPNGVVLDAARDLLWFTNYGPGEVLHVDPAGGGTPVLVGSVAGAALDGIVLDACGNLYAVDQGNSRVYRFNLDAAGALVGEPELIAQLPSNVANAQFGSGEGWNATSLYAAGNPGDVYEIPVGVAGAPVPTVP